MPFFIHLKDKPIDMWLDCRSSTARDAHALLVNLYSEKTHKVSFVASPAETKSWQDREYARFASGEYLRCPWDHDGLIRVPLDVHIVRAQFAHLSLKTPGLIAYTKSDEHGMADRQTTIKPGKYLQEVCPTLHSDVRDRWIAECSSSHLTLQVATDVETIRTVYMNGPSSCMDGQHWHDGEMNSSIHPSAVYADSDLAVAYFGDLTKPKARCVVWPTQKAFYRIYGDKDRMSLLLDAAGYTKSNNPYGARVRAIREGKGYLMPYIDWCEQGTLSDDKHWITLDDEGEISTRCVNGCTSGNSTREFNGEDENSNILRCDRCNEIYNSDISGTEDLCRDCDDHQITCEFCDNTHDNRDEVFTEIGTQLACSDCTEARTSTCVKCEATWIELQICVERSPQVAELYCPKCADTIVICHTCQHVADIHPSIWEPEIYAGSILGAHLRPDTEYVTWGTPELEIDRCPMCHVAASCQSTGKLDFEAPVISILFLSGNDDALRGIRCHQPYSIDRHDYFCTRYSGHPGRCLCPAELEHQRVLISECKISTFGEREFAPLYYIPVSREMRNRLTHLHLGEREATS